MSSKVWLAGLAFVGTLIQFCLAVVDLGWQNGDIPRSTRAERRTWDRATRVRRRRLWWSMTGWIVLMSAAALAFESTLHL
jgi:hypothetical protein